jgi:hypothetical protein
MPAGLLCISDERHPPIPEACLLGRRGTAARVIGKKLACQRTAIGETVEPVAPRILSGVMMKANS